MSRWWPLCVFGAAALGTSGAAPPGALAALGSLATGSPGVVLTQTPIKPNSIDWENARLVLLDWTGKMRLLSEGFVSAADPEISFDGTRLLFAGRRESRGVWQIFEMELASGAARQVTHFDSDCRHPVYQSLLFNLEVQEPWHQIAFESGGSLWSVKLDGSGPRRLTWTPTTDRTPLMLPDGRMIFASGNSERRQSFLFGVNLDGTDYALFTSAGGRHKRMPAVTGRREVVYVESDLPSPDEGGRLALVRLDRPLRTYRVITKPEDGAFHSPSGLSNGAILAAHRPQGGASYGIWRVDPASGERALVYDDPSRHDLQPHLVAPRQEPDGRGSVVEEKTPTARLYCLSVYTSDLTGAAVLPKGSVKRLRVLEALPPSAEQIPVRILGETGIEQDGSFQVTIPANMPVKLQILNSDGLALRSCNWIYARNKENRGCIGCHEDGEMTPENRLAEALNKKAADLALPPDLRRRPGFISDVRPVLTQFCASSGCHDSKARPGLDSAALKPLVRPGNARQSPLVTRINGKGPVGHPPLNISLEARRIIYEWIDTGAWWETPSAAKTSVGGQN